MRAGTALLFIALVLMALAWAKDPRPSPMIEDTTTSQNLSALPTKAEQVKFGSPLHPPATFQHNAGALVVFTDLADVQEKCASTASLKPGEIIWACEGAERRTGAPLIVLFNPCLVAAQDLYAAIVCHELAHVNGWRHE